MRKRLLALLRAVPLVVGGLIIGLAASPSWATLTPRIPEPTSLGILAAGIAGALIVIRLRRRR